MVAGLKDNHKTVDFNGTGPKSIVTTGCWTKKTLLYHFSQNNSMIGSSSCSPWAHMMTSKG